MADRMEEPYGVLSLGEGAVLAEASWSAALKCAAKQKSGWVVLALATKVVAGLRGLLSRSKAGQVFAAWLSPWQ